MSASVFACLAEQLSERRWRRVAIDGVDGAGKTTFAAVLADHLRAAGDEIEVMHTDDFLNPPDVRHRHGRNSPRGFWLDSFDIGHLREAIESVHSKVIVEGVFLHRDELMDLWDWPLYLHAPFEVTTRRTATRDAAEGRSPGDLTRYVEGQKIYFRQCAPWARASHIIDNTDPDSPTFITRRPRI